MIIQCGRRVAMSIVEVADRAEALTTVDSAAVDALGADLRGTVVLPGQAGCDEARTVWNAMIDRRPALAVRCMGAADVIRSIRFARKHDLALAVRGGGHNIAGNAVCDGGLLVDLSQMRSVWVDAMSGRARVGPGATLGDFDREAQAFGWATPLGVNSTTGVAGLTLGGGFGWLSREYGTTVADLLSGLIVFPFERAGDVLSGYRDFVAGAPDDLSVWAVLHEAPPLPFLPA